MKLTKFLGLNIVMLILQIPAANAWHDANPTERVELHQHEPYAWIGGAESSSSATDTNLISERVQDYKTTLSE